MPTLVEPMPRSVEPDKTPLRSCKLHEDLVQMAAFVTNKRGRDANGRLITVADYISNLVRARIEADYRKAVEEEASRVSKPKPRDA